MGRLKSSPSGGEPNPLLRMLGAFLRLERARLGLSTKDVADRLGLTDTYYRLAESGRAALNQNLTFRIIEAFESGTISFTRFAIFLVGAHWVGFEMGSMKNAELAARRATEALALREKGFEVLYERTMAYFDIEEGSNDQKRFLEDVAAPEVGRFLSDENYGQPPLVARDFLGMGDLPTLNIDILLDLKKSLTGRSFVHTDEIAAKWESERGTQFKNFRAIFRSSDLVVDEKNLCLFHYEYLNSTSFINGRFIFVNSDRSATELTTEFVNLVNDGRAKKSITQRLEQREIDKIDFVCLDERQVILFENQIENILKRGKLDLNAYWSFQTHVDLNISFIGVEGDNFENIRNLNLIESEEKSLMFDNLWEAISNAHPD